MAKGKVVWHKRPASEDYAGASRYLDLLYAPRVTKRILAAFRRAQPRIFAAKDLLRASTLPLLPKDDAHVDADLRRIRKGKALPPVLLIRGDASRALPLIVADGYHRICAICYFNENEPVACLLIPP